LVSAQSLLTTRSNQQCVCFHLYSNLTPSSHPWQVCQNRFFQLKRYWNHAEHYWKKFIVRQYPADTPVSSVIQVFCVVSYILEVIMVVALQEPKHSQPNIRDQPQGSSSDKADRSNPGSNTEGNGSEEEESVSVSKAKR
jgi:hypothetical protein